MDDNYVVANKGQKVSMNRLRSLNKLKNLISVQFPLNLKSSTLATTIRQWKKDLRGLELRLQPAWLLMWRLLACDTLRH